MTTIDPLAPVPPLVTVKAVCRHVRNGDLDGLREVTQLISDFADCSITPIWSLPRASEQCDLRLMQRLAARESPMMDQHHRAFLFNEALVHAVKAATCCKEGARERGMAMIEWLCTSYYPRAFVTKGMIEAARHGDLEVIEWLVTHHKRVIWFDACGSAAASGGHLHVLEWLHTHNVLSSRWIHDALPEACANGDRDSVEFLLWHGANSRNLSMSRAAADGHFDIVKLLAMVFEPNVFSTIDGLYSAAANNQLEILQWLTTELPAVRAPLLINCAASNGHLEIVQWLHNNCNAVCKVQAMDNAASNGHLHVVQWLHEHRSEGCTSQAMDGAASNGHFAIVQWLHANRSEGCTTNAMDSAAKIGRLNIVQWLHEHRSEGCTFRAMNNAAENGHLAVVQWLHENRSERCPPIALAVAAANGHLDVVQWLHVRYNKDCTTNALMLAAEGGHLDVVKWLYMTFRHLDLTSGAIDVASTLDVLEWLRLHGVDGCTSRALDSAVMRNNFDKLAFVRAYYPDVACTPNGVVDVVRSGDIEAFLWLHAQFPEVVDLSQVRRHSDKHHWQQVFDIVESQLEVVASGDVASRDAEPRCCSSSVVTLA